MTIDGGAGVSHDNNNVKARRAQTRLATEIGRIEAASQATQTSHSSLCLCPLSSTYFNYKNKYMRHHCRMFFRYVFPTPIRSFVRSLNAHRLHAYSIFVFVVNHVLVCAASAKRFSLPFERDGEKDPYKQYKSTAAYKASLAHAHTHTK